MCGASRLPRTFRAVVVLLVDLDLVRQPGDVGDVDLDRPVPERLHELVGLKLLVLRLVGVTDDHFIDVGLGELLGFDLVFLAGAQQIVEERDVELEDLDEFDDAAVGDIELAVEIEGAGIALGAVLGDLAIVDVAGQLGRVLVLLVLGLERADTDAILLGEDQPAHADIFDDAAPIAPVSFHPLIEHLAAERAEVPFDRDLEVIVAATLVEGVVTSARCSWGIRCSGSSCMGQTARSLRPRGRLLSMRSCKGLPRPRANNAPALS